MTDLSANTLVIHPFRLILILVNLGTLFYIPFQKVPLKRFPRACETNHKHKHEKIRKAG